MKKIEPPPAQSEGFLFGLAQVIGTIGLNFQNSGIFPKEESEDDVSSQVLQLIQRANEDYLYWDKVKYLPKGKIDKVDFWHSLRVFRQINSKYLHFGKYRFSYFFTDRLQELTHRFDLELGGQFGGKGLLAEPDKQKYLISSIMEEAIASSQIEGAVTTRKVAKDLLRKNQPPRNKSQQMIINNYQTINYLSEIKNKELTPALLLELHKSIAKNTLDNPVEEGCFRASDDVNVVDTIDGELVHIPPTAAELSDLIESLCDFFNNDTYGSFIHPIVKAGILHFLIGFIHPFTDGNGRTARALFYWYLLRKGYWLVEYLSISRIILDSRAQYYRSFQYVETDDNDLTYFIHYQANTLQKSLESLQEYIRRKVAEKRRALDFQKLPQINLRQAEILREVYENPDWLINVKEIENRFAVSNQTARTDLLTLEKLGYLTKGYINAKEQKYYKSKRFDELIKA